MKYDISDFTKLRDELDNFINNETTAADVVQLDEDICKIHDALMYMKLSIVLKGG